MSNGETMMKQIQTLHNRAGVIMIVMVATVVTWGLIDTTRRVLFQPWLISVIGLEDSRVKLGNGQTADLGAFYSVLVTWFVLMSVLGFITLGWYLADKAT
jgi:hypothetical protein